MIAETFAFDTIPVALTIYASSAPLSKSYALADGRIVKTPAAQMTAGTARTIEVPFAALADVFDSLGSDEATGYGLFNAEVVRIATAKTQRPPATFARTAEHCQYRPRPGVLMIDHDPRAGAEPIPAADLLRVLAGIVPGMADAAVLIRPSVSAGVRIAGTDSPPASGGYHIYMPVADAADIPRFGAALFRRLWLAGHGYVALASNGKALVRACIDAAVFAGERLDFTGRPIVGDGLECVPPAADYRHGGYLDTAALADLSDAETAAYTALVESAKTAAKPAGDARFAAWAGERAASMRAAGVAEGAINAALHAMRPGSTADLHPAWPLHFTRLGIATVAEVMAAPARYDGEPLADPVEGPAYGLSTARFYANLPDGRPVVNSMAHGGALYFLPEPRVTLSPPAAPAPALTAGVLESASPAEGKAPQTNPERLSYSATKSGTFWVKRQEDGNDEHVFLANFTAEIVAETTIDDGAERKRRMEIAGSINGRPLPPATVASGEFAALGWVGEQWGSAAHIAPGHGKKDRLRYAIQVLSESTQHRMVYQHTGWREIGGQWVYLTPTAVIGAAGAVGGIDVDLPGTLADYALMPAPADTAAAAARASLGVLSCAPAPIAVPLFLAPYRAMLGEALPGDFSLFLAGVTGSRKTEMAAIAQAHFGEAWHGKRLPAAWSSTPNSLERAAFLAKDAVMVVDDFCPTGTTADIARFHTGADRLLRAQGNRAGRQRMNADGTLRPAYHPRGLIVATGEDIPRGQSLRGRLLILEFDSATVDLGALSTMQAHASTGRLSAAAGAFAQWLAPRMGELKKSLPVMRNQLRSEITATAHSRHPDTLAGLMLTSQLFAQFATDHGVVLPAEWQADITNALLQAGADQQQAVASEEPAGRFVRLVHSGLSAGLCHVRRKDGREPYAAEDMTAAGWQLRHLGSGEHAHDEWLPQGPCIGWFDDNGLYLDPDAGYRSAARFASDQGQALPLTPRALFKALDNRGHIVTKNPGRTTVKHRFGDGTTKSVLHLFPIPMRNCGNNGNNGNNSTKADDFHEKNVFPFAGTGKELSGTTGTGTGTGTGTDPVGTDDCSRNVPAVPAMFPQAFSEREQKNACNTLTSKENLQPVPVVPVVPANENIPTNNFAGVALSPVARTVKDTLRSCPGGMKREDLERVVLTGRQTAGPALIRATIDNLLLAGEIVPTAGRIALGAGHSSEVRRNRG